MATMTLAFGLIGALSAFHFASAQNTPTPGLASVSWSSGGEHSLSGRPPSLAEVQALVNHLRRTDFTVCFFRFVNLRNAGTLSLVTFVDEGSGFCNHIDIVDKDASGFAISEIEESRASGDDYGKAIQDLDADGVSELVVKNDFASYLPDNGSVYFLLWPIIYRWNGSGYVDASNHFSSYYQRFLKATPQELWARPLMAALPTCLDTAEHAKIERFLGLDLTAGIDDAITCAGNNSPAERELALLLLADIGTGSTSAYPSA